MEMSKPYELSEEEAKVVAVALIHYANYLAGEAEAISNDTSSEFVREAAYARYNKSVEGASKLHVSLAEHFPTLTQP